MDWLLPHLEMTEVGPGGHTSVLSKQHIFTVSIAVCFSIVSHSEYHLDYFIFLFICLCMCACVCVHMSVTMVM